MLERRRGAVLNISCPSYTSASKAFVSLSSKWFQPGVGLFVQRQGNNNSSVSFWVCCEQGVEGGKGKIGGQGREVGQGGEVGEGVEGGKGKEGGEREYIMCVHY